ncbi:major facilitator superfamily MFS_1 [Candidatus Sodalis pierantonius str. SOPE]|uniref:Major facilitator superfamily MFS_1 n=1 Tax=Candidatus Sodalis pierantonii str. SOPE TaxID=2342 RepID=W0HKZ4_9GAMM|nr:MFS transporter [Candidatus Sodalis pierantonius]AHF74546.1 major facilitator superfamily MFS_1 [Candidatus Sodalis pierantonius str. SOPE]
MQNGSIAPDDNDYWRRNLVVCVLGSFTTIVAMTLLLPFLSLYVEQLGVTGHAAISEWSGVAYGAAFFTAALTAPLWGRLGDRYGRKLMLIRASLGMAVAMTLLGMAQSVWQLVALRLLAGLLGGYASGSTILVATQTPKARTGWALGMLSSGIMEGNLVGPLIGGTLPPLIGIRGTFMLAGGAIFIALLATVVVLKEVPGTASRPAAAVTSPAISPWRNLPVMAMLITGTLLMLANMSIEPIITLYVAQLVSGQQVTFVAGLVMAAAALGSILSASRLGRLADRVGHWRVIIGCLLVAAVLLIPQAFVTAGWQLVALRFCMGLALGGLLPCIASVIRHSVPEAKVGGHLGMRPVFLGTCLLLAIGAGFNQLCRNAPARSAGDVQGRP